MVHNLNKETGKVTYKPVEETQPLKPEKNSFSSDDIGVRSALNALGFENSAIGYNGKNVTYNGADIVAPKDNINGVTKTDTKGLIDGVNSYYKNQGSDDYVVDVTEYAAMAGKLPNAVKYNENGTVTVGGVPIENVVIIDGNSFAPKSAIEAAVKKLKDSTGYKTHQEMADKYLSGTKKEAEEYMDKINNYAPFAYDPEDDPVYKAYAAMYERKAKDAYENLLHMNNAKTGGYSNSAAITSANQAYYDHMSELSDRIPELAADAYERYNDDYEKLWKGLGAYGSPAQRYEIARDAGEADIKAAYDALLEDYKRDIANRDFNYQQMVDLRDFDYRAYLDDKDFEYKAAMDAWERDNILIPRSMLYQQEYDFNNIINPLSIELEEAKLRNQNLDNKVLTKRYGVK